MSGTIANDAGGATLSFNPGSAAAGGGTARVGLGNAYNRAPVRGFVKDTVGQYTYATASWRAASGSTINRVTCVVGLQEDWWRADYSIVAAGDSTGSSTTGIGFNSTTAPTGFNGYLPSSGSANQTLAAATVQPIGSNYLAPLEYVSAGTKTFDGGGYFAPIQPGMIWEGRY